MKTALIIVGSIAALALGWGVYTTVKMVKANKIIKDPAKMWEAYANTLPVYSTNADALEAGMTVGSKYRTPANDVKTVTAAA